MPTITQVLLGGVLPGFIATVLLVLGWRAWSHTAEEGAEERGAWMGPIAVIGAYLVGFLATNYENLPSVPPHSTKDWLPFIAPAALVAGLFAWWVSGRDWRTALRFLLALLPVLLLLPIALNYLLGGILNNEYPYYEIDKALQAQPVAIIGGASLLALLVLAGLELSIGRARRGTAGAFLLSFWAALAAGALGMGGSFGFALAMGSLSASAGAFFVVSIWAPRVGMKRGTLAAWWTMAVLLLALGVFFAEVPWWAAIVLAVAPLAALVALLPWLKGLDHWIGAIVAVVLMTAVSGGALYPIYRSFAGLDEAAESSSGSGSGYDYDYSEYGY